MEKNSQIMEIDLLELFFVLLKKWWIIVISAILCAGIAFTWTKLLIVPEYTAGIKMYINNSSVATSEQSDSISSGDISASKNLVDTYSVILKTRLTMEEVIKNSGVDYTYEQLSSMITTSAVDNTEVLEVKVVSTNPEEACKIANTIADVLPKKIVSIVEGSSYTIVDYAVVPTSPSSPSYVKNTAIGFFAGCMFSVVIILLVYFFNDVINSEEMLSGLFGENVPILAVIPDVNEDTSGKNTRYGNYYKSNPYLNMEDKKKS